MDSFYILLIGLLIVVTIPGLIFILVDLLGPTETYRISRADFDTIAADISIRRMDSAA